MPHSCTRKEMAMPQEKIKARVHDVEVHWDPAHRFVQVAVTVQPPGSGAPVSLREYVAANQEMGDASGLFSDLNRHDVDRLISTLQRARDEVFTEDANG